MTLTLDAGVQEYWDWLAVILFLLVTFDMVTTVDATRLLGRAARPTP